MGRVPFRPGRTACWAVRRAQRTVYRGWDSERVANAYGVGKQFAQMQMKGLRVRAAREKAARKAAAREGAVRRAIAAARGNPAVRARLDAVQQLAVAEEGPGITTWM